ncbi:hypothetical protein HAX54_028891 [Datura stramonium]|uniref:Uncharacterized protein n=1 Tax=Datura stramonium TaxID=4076 RepID=A0ABS8V7N7_DATST|nr:hypothetical protein [Datura stramonium]
MTASRRRSGGIARRRREGRGHSGIGRVVVRRKREEKKEGGQGMRWFGRFLVNGKWDRGADVVTGSRNLRREAIARLISRSRGFAFTTVREV